MTRENRSVVFPFAQKVENLEQPECTAPHWTSHEFEQCLVFSKKP